MSQEFDTLLKDAAHAYDHLRSSRFQRLGRLGSGGMAVVYRALDRKLGREVALKYLRSDFPDDPEMVARFRREARVTAGLDHPNIVRVFDAGEENGRNYIAMECIEGRPLSEILGKRSFEVGQMLRLLEKAARGVAAAHAGGIVHRDLKPANILVDESGEPKVSDFGLALSTDLQTTRLTRDGASVGTPSYMAPEQAEGRVADISPRTDVYGLGAILYEILTGRPPYVGSTPLEVLKRISGEDPAPPRRLNRRVHSEVDAICMKALERSPRRRYADAGEFADDLRNHFESRAVSARPVGPTTLAIKWTRRHPGVAAASAALVILLGGLLGSRVITSSRISWIERRIQSAGSAAEREQLWREAMELSPDDEALRLQWERAQRRASAVRHTAQAEEAERQYEKVEREIERQEVELAKRERETKPSEREKPGVWALSAELERLRNRAASLRADMLGGYSRAAGVDAGYSPPRTFLAQWHWEKFESAERMDDRDKAAEHLAFVLQYDSGRFRLLLAAPGGLRIETIPSGARVNLARVEAAEDRRLLPAGARDLGPTPTAAVSLPPGSYVATVSLEGYPDVRVPVRIRRNVTERALVRMRSADEIGPGYIHVPGGEILSGEDDEKVHTRVEPFLMARHETTWTEFVGYLNDRLGARAAARMFSLPEGGRPEWREEGGRIALLAGGDRPAMGVTWHEAADYCAWLSGRDAKAAYRLPTSLQWEAAARGADGRRYPWGDVFDWSFMNGLKSRPGVQGPVSVGTFPKDESVYGVRDMAGNVEEWCDDDFDVERGMKVIRGGAWDDERAEDFMAGKRDGDKPGTGSVSAGFRVVRIYPK